MRPADNNQQPFHTNQPRFNNNYQHRTHYNQQQHNSVPSYYNTDPSSIQPSMLPNNVTPQYINNQHQQQYQSRHHTDNLNNSIPAQQYQTNRQQQQPLTQQAIQQHNMQQSQQQQQSQQPTIPTLPITTQQPLSYTAILQQPTVTQQAPPSTTTTTSSQHQQHHTTIPSIVDIVRYPVEILEPSTLAWFSGYVVDYDINKQQVLVGYVDNWRPHEYKSLSQIRPGLAPYNHNEFHPVVNSIVEVAAKAAEDEPYSWWLATIKSIKGEFYYITYNHVAEEYSEVIEKELIRPANNIATFQHVDIQRHTLHVPHIIVKNNNALQNLSDELIKVRHDSHTLSVNVNSNNDIVITGTLQNIKTAELLINLLIKHLINLTLERELLNEKTNQLTTAKQLIQNLVTQTFSIDRLLIGKIIGKQGNNIKKAHSIQGIHNIHIDNTKGTITIKGDNNECVNEARSILEYISDKFSVPYEQFKKFVGFQNIHINEIQENTHSIINSDYMDGKYYNKGELITFNILGTKTNVVDANLLMSHHLRLVQQYTDVQQSTREAQQQLNELTRDISKLSFDGRRNTHRPLPIRDVNEFPTLQTAVNNKNRNYVNANATQQQQTNTTNKTIQQYTKSQQQPAPRRQDDNRRNDNKSQSQQQQHRPVDNRDARKPLLRPKTQQQQQNQTQTQQQPPTQTQKQTQQQKRVEQSKQESESQPQQTHSVDPITLLSNDTGKADLKQNDKRKSQRNKQRDNNAQYKVANKTADDPKQNETTASATTTTAANTANTTATTVKSQTIAQPTQQQPQQAQSKQSNKSRNNKPHPASKYVIKNATTEQAETKESASEAAQTSNNNNNHRQHNKKPNKTVQPVVSQINGDNNKPVVTKPSKPNNNKQSKQIQYKIKSNNGNDSNQANSNSDALPIVAVDVNPTTDNVDVKLNIQA